MDDVRENMVSGIYVFLTLQTVVGLALLFSRTNFMYSILFLVFSLIIMSMFYTYRKRGDKK